MEKGESPTFHPDKNQGIPFIIIDIILPEIVIGVRKNRILIKGREKIQWDLNISGGVGGGYFLS